MNQEKYEELVKYISNNGIEPNTILFEEDNFARRVFLGRFLCSSQYKKYKEAIELFEDILKNEFESYESSCSFQKEVPTFEEYIEQKVWLLKDLSKCYLIFNNDKKKALEYINKSLSLAESVDHEFDFIVRGEIWKDKIYILRLLGESVEEKIDEIINKYNDGIKELDSYVPNAYLMKFNKAIYDNYEEDISFYLNKLLLLLPLVDMKIISLNNLKTNSDYSRLYIELDKIINYYIQWKF